MVFDSYNRYSDEKTQTKAELIAYGQSVRDKLATLFATKGKTMNWKGPANVYYGKQTVHEFLERTTWHAGQHTRQLQAVVESLGLVPNTLITAETLSGLPMPANIYDDQMVIA